MDKYINVLTKKATEKNSIVGREEIIRKIRHLVVNDKIPLLMVYGKSGVGKTTVVHESLRDLNYVYYDSVQDVDIHEMSNYHVLVEDLNNNIVAYLECKNRLSLGTTILILHNPIELKCETIEITPLSITNLEEIYPCHKSAVLSAGNIHNFNFYCQSSDVKDVFKSSYDIVSTLLCTKHIEVNEYINKKFDDRGYVWSIIHENYTDYSAINMETVSELISLADIIDTKLYKGYNEMYPMFNMFGIIMPSIHIKGSLDAGTLRPGSCWTKFNNFKMREGKLKLIKHKLSHLDNIELIRTYIKCNREKALEHIHSCKLVSCDIDVINHLGIQNKIKSTTLQSFKKLLKS